YAGTYNYQVSQSEQAWGIKGRLEERVNDSLDFNLTYSNDRVFGNSVVLAAGYRFGARRNRDGASRGDVEARRGDRVERNHQIVLQNNQRFLGEGATVPHLFVASQGTFLLPRATMNLAQPIINGAPANAITLANNNEVSGFSVINSGLNGIFGDGVTGVNIN